MNSDEIKDFSVKYLYNVRHEDYPIEYWKLNIQLGHVIKDAVRRLSKTFGEVTRKDIAILIETWLIKTHNYKQPPLELDQPKVDRDNLVSKDKS